jgi:hypothetical protein
MLKTGLVIAQISRWINAAERVFPSQKPDLKAHISKNGASPGFKEADIQKSDFSLLYSVHNVG